MSNTSRMITVSGLLLVAALVAGLLAGCDKLREEGIPLMTEHGTTLEAGETEHYLANTTQLTYETLRIGAGNFWQETYADAAGDTVEGTTAALWLYFRDTPDANTSLRVYPGMIIEEGGYRIRVLDVVPAVADQPAHVMLALRVQ